VKPLHGKPIIDDRLNYWIGIIGT